MRCVGCGLEKLSREFPQEPISDDCDHPALHCYKCVLDAVGTKSRCPWYECKTINLNLNHPKCKLYRVELDRMFGMPVDHEAEELAALTQNTSDKISVCSLTGHKIPVPFDASYTVHQLKRIIEQGLHIPPINQKLMYKNITMKTHGDGKVNTLADYHVVAGATVHLIRLLVAIPEDCDDVTFDIYWRYPPSAKVDFLDASCLVYGADGRCLETVDFAQEESTMCPTLLTHSGDVMDRVRHVGHHEVQASLKKLPATVRRLYFVISSWNSPRVSLFDKPSFKLVDNRDIFKPLCKSEFKSEELDKQAFVMAYAEREDQLWFMYELGLSCPGNTDNYSPIKGAIDCLVKT